MTCPDRPHDLDLLLAGEPVSEDVRQHAETCEACAEEVALDAQITAALASRRTVSAPTGLVAAALAEAHRGAAAPAPSHRLAAPRPAIRAAQPRRLRVAAFAVLAAFALAMAWVLRPVETPVEQPLTAEAPAVQRLTPDLPASVDPPEELQTPDADAPPSEPAPEAVAPAPRQRRAVPRAPRRAQRAAPPAPEIASQQDDLAQNDPAEDAEPSPEEIARAEAELKLAFALVGDAQDRARRVVRTSADALAPTIDHALPF
ncbi:MAG: hypothetical protein AAGI52_00450 [Bacteroidota bacterium]